MSGSYFNGGVEIPEHLPVTRGASTGFVDNYEATANVVRLIDNSFSEEKAWNKAKRQRLKKIEEITGERFIAPDAPDHRIPSHYYYDNAEREYIKRSLEKMGDSDRSLVKSDQELREDIANEAKEAEANLSDISSRATFAGKVGGFTGGTAASLEDPVNIASMGFGGGGKTFAGRIGREVLASTLSEAAIQVKVQSYRGSMGLESGMDHALQNIVFAGAGAGVFGGAIEVAAKVPKTIRGVASHLRQKKEPTANDNAIASLIERTEEVSADSPFEASVHGDAFHRKRMDEAFDALEKGRLPEFKDAPANIRQAVRITDDRINVSDDLSVMRNQVKDFYKQESNKLPVTHAELGEIRIVRDGIQKALWSSADPDKIRILSHIREVLENSRLVDTIDAVAKPGRKDSLVRYIHRLSGSVVLDNVNVPVITTIKEDMNGNKFFNINKDTKKEAGDDQRYKAGPLTSSSEKVTQDSKKVNLGEDTINLEVADVPVARHRADISKLVEDADIKIDELPASSVDDVPARAATSEAEDAELARLSDPDSAEYQRQIDYLAHDIAEHSDPAFLESSVVVSQKVDEQGNIVPETKTVKELLDEIESEQEFIDTIKGCGL